MLLSAKPEEKGPCCPSIRAACGRNDNKVVATVVNVKSGMLPAEQITKFMRANEFLFPKNGEEAMAKQLGHGADDSLRQVVKTTVGCKQAVGGRRR